MSLQVWLPLITNLNNQGCGTATISAPSTTFTLQKGKIGNASYTSSSTITVNLPSIASSRIWSVTFWAYAVSANITTNWTRVIRIADGGDMFRVEVCPSSYNSGQNCYSTHNNAAYKIAQGSVGSPSGGYYDQWFHMAITCDGTTISVYHNGTLRGTQKYTGDGAITGYFYIENSDKTYKNDFRIYDHCLSVKEIREIAKGLCLHFPMNDQYALGAINKYSTNRAEGDTSGSSWTKTKLSNERGYNFKGTRTGDGNNSWWSFIFPTFTFTVGKRYYYSLKCRCHKFTNATLYLRAARSSNDWVTSTIAICSTSLADGKWHEYSVSQVINETYDRSGSTITCAPVLEAYTSNMNGNGTVYDMEFDLKDIQVVESDNYIPYIQNDYAGNKVCDISGYNRVGTTGGTTGNLKFINDSPRYDGCYDFTNPAYILYNGLPTNMYYATYTFWVYFKSFTAYGGYHMQENNPSGGNVPWFSANTEGASLWCYFGGNSPNYTKAGSANLVTNTWYHVAYVWNNGVAQWYLNGAKYGNSVTYTGKTYIPNGVNATIGDSYTGTSWNGTPFNGRISDFRIYATALSADNIAELYRASAEIDSNGTMYASDFTEV